MQSAVHALGLGYYFTGKEEYAARATLLLRTWFLDPATRMNPNLNYAQAVLGVDTGRGTGLIDVRGIPRLLDGITLLSGSRALTAQDQAALHKWFSDYLNWLEPAKTARMRLTRRTIMEAGSISRSPALHCSSATRTWHARSRRPRRQSELPCRSSRTARDPLELARTKSFSYSVFNLTALEWLAVESRLVSIDLWSYHADNGASIRAALDYLLPYADGTKKWTYQALNGVEGDSLTEPLLLAAINYHNPEYLSDAKKLEKKPGAETLLLQAQAEAANAAK